MPIDFHYVPLAPEPLSGPEFITQTERAFNELGVEIDNANNTANTALSTADSALATANAALQTAQEADAEADARTGAGVGSGSG